MTPGSIPQAQESLEAIFFKRESSLYKSIELNGEMEITSI